MKQLSADFEAHLHGDTTSLCHCWKLERVDGVIMGFTDHDHVIEFEGVEFEPQSGFDAAAAETALGLSPSNTQVAGALSSQAITEDDIAAGLYDDATVTVYLVNWLEPEQRLLQMRYKTGEIIRSGEHFSVDLESPVTALDQTSGRSFTRLCDADFGDERCGVLLSNPLFSTEGQISRIIAPAVYEVTGLEAFEQGWFTNGKLQWEETAANFSATMVANHKERAGKSIIRLWEPPSQSVAIGDRFTVIAGCDKRFSTCRDRFSNQLRFRGFPYLPGNDFAMNYAANSSEHDGGPLFE